ncbi:MAG TPA: ATP-binding protein [Dehalococcoidia bacterium]|nr:ATP-binding protein [Dehalococcoidia bacterium]
MTIFLFLPLLAFLVNAMLVPIVLWGHIRQQTHRVFALFLVGMALWGATIFMVRFSTTIEQALFWNQLVFINFSLIVVLFLHFTYLFSGRRISRIGYAAIYGMVPTVAVLALAGLISDRMQIKYHGYAPMPGELLPIFLVLVYSAITLALRNLISVYRGPTSQVQRNRAGYLITGTCFSLLGATVDWLPLVGPAIYPLGIVGNILFAGLTCVTITRHRLMDIHIALGRSMGFLLVIILIAGLFVLASLAIERTFSGNYFATAFSIGVGIMVVGYLLFSPLLGKAQDGIDRAFLRRRWGPLQELLQFTTETGNMPSWNTLTDSILQLVKRAMDTEVEVLLLPSLVDEPSWSSISVGTDAQISDSLNSKSPWLLRLAREGRAFLAEEIFAWPEWQYAPGMARAQVQDLDIKVFLPLRHRGELTGLLLLGSKTSGRGYTLEELDLLEAAALHVAATMANARLYAELRIQLAELKETQAQLVQSGKLASVGTLAAGIAHEINNPLFAISGMAELLLASPELHLRSEEATEYVRVISEMSERIAKVVQGLLVFSRNDDVAVPVCLNDVVDDTLHLMEHKLRSGGINVVRRYYPDLPPTRAVANQLQQALLNLIINAGDAMGTTGTLTLLTGVSGVRVWVSCHDTGSGISEANRDKIFDAFFTTKVVGKGTGLGLYITHRIVENFGGEVKFDSRPGVGTSFTIYLPMRTVEADDLISPAEPGHEAGSGYQGSGYDSLQPTAGFGLDSRGRS